MKAQGAGLAQQRFRRVARPVALRLWDFRLEGFERLPAEGPAILAPNHISFLDSAFLMLHVPRNISFVGKAEYMDSWKTKFLFPMLGMIPIDRSGGERSQAALETAERVLTDSDAASLRFEPGMVRWRNIEWPVASLTDLRLEGVTGLGSCSIREPAEEIRALSGRAR
mgnify:CR=1 FL=1